MTKIVYKRKKKHKVKIKINEISEYDIRGKVWPKIILDDVRKMG